VAVAGRDLAWTAPKTDLARTGPSMDREVAMYLPQIIGCLAVCSRFSPGIKSVNLPLSGILSLMLHSYPRWALLLLSSTIFVQTLAVEILYSDIRVKYSPSDTSWCVNNSCDVRKQEISSDPRETRTYTTKDPCPGIYTSLADGGKHTISLNFTGY